VTKQLAVNCSPLILLGRISRLDLLPALAERVVVPRAVIGELKSKDHEDWLAQTVSSHPGIEVVDAPPLTEEIQRWRLGEGESAVLSFCLANPGFRAVLDDLRGRRCALALGVPISGTLGLIVEARRRELIPVARPLVAAIRGFGYYIEDHLIEAALRQVGETWME
jgi:predicted nucleic acid-binding protein